MGVPASPHSTQPRYSAQLNPQGLSSVGTANRNSHRMSRQPKSTEDTGIAPDENYLRPNGPPLLIAWSEGAQRR